MFGIPDDAIYDPAALALEEQQRATDKRFVTKAIFLAFVLFAPGIYWFIVAGAWAPIPYAVALALAEPANVWLLAIPACLYALIDWGIARGLAMLIVLFERRMLRLLVAAILVALLLTYASMPLYEPMSGSSGPQLNFIEIILHAFGPQLNGVC